MRLVACSIASLSLCALAAPAAAQFGMPTPPKQLKKFDPMLGHWEGKGTMAIPAPGQESAPWTASITFEKILDGFFVREDVTVRTSAPQPMQFRTIYGYDQFAKKYVACGVGNQGRGFFGEVDWVDGAMCVMMRSSMEGVPSIQRGVWRIDGDKMTFVEHMAIGLGDFQKIIDGAFERVDEPKPAVADASFPGTEVAEPMKKLDKMVGTWRIEAKMVPMPGMPEQEIGGTETMFKMWDGHVLASHVVGDPMGGMKYEGYNFMVWNPEEECYDAYMLDNMGVMVHSEARWMGKQLIHTSMHLAMGQPRLQRWIVEMGDDGPTRIEAQSMMGPMAPYTEFTGTYKKKKD